MNRTILSLIIAIILSYFFLFKIPANNLYSETKEQDVSEDYFLMRSYPDSSVDMKAYDAAVKDAMSRYDEHRTGDAWTVEGPGNIGGRINCMAIEPDNPNVIYAGNATGGVFKTADGGITWNPIFDDEPYLSIGAITIDPRHPQTVWVGTGDVNISGYVFIGDGIYKSTDGGATWKNMGLSETKIISKIIIDPTNSDVVYVSTMGLPFETNVDRGLYKSTDGGLTWNKILFVDVDAGIIDMVMDPTDPNVIYAASWNRIRNNFVSVAYGPDAHIYKSTDAGNNWTILKNGLPDFSTSRIGLAISKQNHSKLYAVIVDTAEFSVLGIYKTSDGGNSWMNTIGTVDHDQFGTQGWYFGKIYVNPENDEQVYVPGVDMQASDDGGKSWQQATPSWFLNIVHADGHYIEFVDGNTFYYCTDGGMYKTTDNTASWTDVENIPNTQFYHVTYNTHDVNNYFGGAQDNGTITGNGVGFNSWYSLFGGDGFKPYYDPNDPNLQYAETQNGGIWYTPDDGLHYYSIVNGIDLSEWRSWDMPYLMSTFNSSIFFCGTYRLYEMTDAPGGTWAPISPDLTQGPHDRYHVITTLAQSPLNPDIIYTGTSDGKAWATTDGGNSWNDLSASLPDRYVTSVQASPNNSNNVYITHSGYRDNDYIPHVHKSNDDGKTWTDISGDLPQLGVNDILISPGNENVIFVATDGGVYKTENGGVNWNRLGNNMPFIPVYDLEFNFSNNKVIAGTFARSIWTIDAGINVSVPSIDLMAGEISVYPNPVKDVLNVHYTQHKNMSVTIYDASGNIMLSKKTDAGSSDLAIPFNDFAAGVYYIRFDDGKEDFSKKLVKMNE